MELNSNRTRENLVSNISCDLCSFSPQYTWVDKSAGKCFSLSLTFVAGPSITISRVFYSDICRMHVRCFVFAKLSHASRWPMALPALSLSVWLIDSGGVQADENRLWWSVRGWKHVDRVLTTGEGNGNYPWIQCTSLYKRSAFSITATNILLMFFISFLIFVKWFGEKKYNFCYILLYTFQNPCADFIYIY